MGETLVMTPAGSGWYTYNLSAESIPGFVRFENAWVQYQLVAYDKSYTKVASSDVYSDLELSACHQ
jgi:hypothetical protein